MLTKEQQQEQALAAWESAITQNLAPLLPEEEHAVIWEAVLEHRESKDNGVLATALRELTAHASQRIRDIIERAITALPAQE